jgi:hypothetical protein
MNTEQHESGARLLEPRQPSVAPRAGFSKNCSMPRRVEFALVLIVAAAIAAAGSHSVVIWLKVRTKASQLLTFGKPNGRPPAFFCGSSLAGYGIDWERIAHKTDTEIISWGIAGGTPTEFEQFQKKVPEARTTYIVVSAYDLNEANVCDFRASLVPLVDTIKTLIAVRADWTYSQRALAQYPMTWLRTLFPTLGRSRSIMGSMRERLLALVKPASGSTRNDSEPRFDVAKERAPDTYRLQKVSDWPESKIISKCIAERAASQGSDSFDGPKRLAFDRMLQCGCKRGRTIVVVLPESASYSKGLLTPDQAQKFQAELANLRHRYPKVEWLRLDEVPGLNSDENYCDLVHMNVYGQEKTTKTFLAWLKQTSQEP